MTYGRRPVINRAPPPHGHVSLREVIGLRAVVHPMRPRPRQAGLLPLDAAAVAAEVAAGALPAPVRGPWGLAWPLEAVRQWGRRHRPQK